MARIRFCNAKIILPDRIEPGDVLVHDGVIEDVLSPSAPDFAVDASVDVGGLYLSPGFIDIHVHGGGGADFSDGDEAGVRAACREHMRHGTTSIVPTSVAADSSGLTAFVDLFNRVDKNPPDGARILGIHLEGPYLSPGQCGAQSPLHIRNPDPQEYAAILSRPHSILRWSFAPELPGAAEFLSALKQQNILASLAHSDATFDQVEVAASQGLSVLTHFYSGMSGVKRIHARRVGGVIEAGYLLDDLYVEAIADGKHLPPELLRLMYKVKGPGRMCLVTDAMRAAGMPDGNYILGNIRTGTPCVVADDVAKLPDGTSFAGSTATTDRLVRTITRAAGVPLYDAVRMMTLTPAELMGVSDRFGSITPGKTADLLLFDEGIHIHAVYKEGQLVT